MSIKVILWPAIIEAGSIPWPHTCSIKLWAMLNHKCFRTTHPPPSRGLCQYCIALYLYLIWSSRACTIHSTQLALIRSVNNWTKGENKRTVLYIHSSRTIVNSESLNPPSGTNYFRKGYVMYTGFVYVRFVAYNMQIRDIKISKMMNQHLNKVTSLIWLPSSDRYFIFKHIEFL